MKIKIPLILFINCLISSVYAQSPKVVPTSPEASALAKMINYPVDLNTGVPDISIPLYNLETGGLVLPVNLNYHAGGFKINEQATSIGLGWSLSCDIQITRSINGRDDFEPGNGYIANKKIKTYYEQFGQCIDCDYPLRTGMNDYAIASGGVDGMPDKFNYKLLNKAGSFYFRKTDSGTGYTIVPVPYDNIKIQYNNGQFIIKDTDGSTYSFGTPGAWNSSSTLEERGFEISGNGYPNADYISAWKCKKIENTTKTESINFTYQPKSKLVFTHTDDYAEYYMNENRCSSVFTNYNSTDFTAYGSIQQLFTHYSFSELLSPRYIESGYLTIPYLDRQGKLMKKTYNLGDEDISLSRHSSGGYVNGLAIKSISFKGGSLSFSGADELNSIKVQNSADQELKSFEFFQSYAKAAYEQNAKKFNGEDFKGTRYLDSVHVKNAGITYNKYSLIYKDKYCFGSHLKGQDAWGYVNASTRENLSDNNYNPSSMAFSATYVNQYIDKLLEGCGFSSLNALKIGGSATAESPDKEGMQKGLLKRIIYPTGGFVDFEFEANMFNENVLLSGKPAQGARMGGGLRVNSINYYDGKSKKPVTQKYYRYGELEDGIGILINYPKRVFNGESDYEAFNYTQNVVYKMYNINTECRTGCLTLLRTEKVTTYLPASSLNYSYPTGAPIYYTKVTEYQGNLGENTGKTVHEFYPPEKFLASFATAPQNMISGTNIQIIHPDGLMGVQKSMKDYKFINGLLKLTHSKEFEYTKYQQKEQVRVVYSFFKTIYRALGGYPGDNASLYSDPADVSNGTPHGRYEDYSSSQYGIPVAKLLLANEREKWINGADTVTQNTGYFYDNNLYLQPSRIVTRNSVGNEITKSLKYSYDFGGVSIYDQMKSQNMISQPVEEIIKNGSSTELSRVKTNYEVINAGFGFIAPVSIQKSYRGSGLETEVRFDLYDQYANPIQITGKDLLPKVYLWGYGYKYPIAEITGTNYNYVTTLTNTTVLQNSTDDAYIIGVQNTLRTSLPNAMVNSFTYKPLLGMTSQTDMNGKKRTYEYDGFGRLIIVKNNEGYITNRYSYQETGPVSSIPFSLFSVNNPMMISYGKNCIPTEKYVPQNKIIAGGSVQSGGDIGSANLFAEYVLSGYYGDSVPITESNGDCADSAESLQITLKRFMFNGLATPDKVYIELIQDNSIVASKEFPSTDTSTSQFYVRKGQYKVSMRHNANYKNSNLKYLIQPSVGEGLYVLPGDVVNFVQGVTYSITITNAL